MKKKKKKKKNEKNLKKIFLKKKKKKPDFEKSKIKNIFNVYTNKNLFNKKNFFLDKKKIFTRKNSLKKYKHQRVKSNIENDLLKSRNIFVNLNIDLTNKVYNENGISLRNCKIENNFVKKKIEKNFFLNFSGKKKDLYKNENLKEKKNNFFNKDKILINQKMKFGEDLSFEKNNHKKNVYLKKKKHYNLKNKIFDILNPNLDIIYKNEENEISEKDSKFNSRKQSKFNSRKDSIKNLKQIYEKKISNLNSEKNLQNNFELQNSKDKNEINIIKKRINNKKIIENQKNLKNIMKLDSKNMTKRIKISTKKITNLSNGNLIEKKNNISKKRISRKNSKKTENSPKHENPEIRPKKRKRKLNHKKNLSMPQNAISNFVKNLKLPIQFENKGNISMTPQISKPSSPSFKKQNIKKKKKIFKISEKEIDIDENSDNSFNSLNSLNSIKSKKSLESLKSEKSNNTRKTSRSKKNSKSPKIKKRNKININTKSEKIPKNPKKTGKTQKLEKNKKNIKNFKNSKSSSSKAPKDIHLKKLELQTKLKHSKSKKKIPKTSLEYYNITKILGEGAYARVYLGTSVLCGKKVAIKCYERSKITSKSTKTRILQEIDLLRNIDFENIIKLYEIFENKKYIFIVLEYVDNGDLLLHLKKFGVFEENEFLFVFKQIVKGLFFLHQNCILHRDIKLDNVLLNKEEIVKICDFGISRRIRGKKRVFEHIGTPAYLAPEIVNGEGYGYISLKEFEIWENFAKNTKMPNDNFEIGGKVGNTKKTEKTQNYRKSVNLINPKYFKREENTTNLEKIQFSKNPTNYHYKKFGVDIWALGVMSYIALTGQVPFKGNSSSELNHNILNKKVDFKNLNVKISENLKIVILRMLEKNPVKRISLKEISQILGFDLNFKKDLRFTVDIDFKVIDMINDYGFDRMEILKSIKMGKFNHVSALYKLLK